VEELEQEVGREVGVSVSSEQTSYSHTCSGGQAVETSLDSKLLEGSQLRLRGGLGAGGRIGRESGRVSVIWSWSFMVFTRSQWRETGVGKASR
jgi:hypothetical protein